MPNIPADSDDSPIADRLYELAAGQAGMLTARAALEVGIARSTLEYHARGSGQLERRGRGLYRLRRFPFTPLTPLWSAFLPLSHADAVLSHDTALWLLRLLADAPAVIELTLPRAERWRRPRPGTRLHFTSTPPATPPVRLAGLPVSHPREAVLAMLAAEGGTARTGTVARLALRRGLVRPSELLAAWPEPELGLLVRLVRDARR